jgi:hypothetical protein
MNSINSFPFGPFPEAVLAAVTFRPQLLLAEKPEGAGYLRSTKIPKKFVIDFEDHRNHGIGD